MDDNHSMDLNAVFAEGRVRKRGIPDRYTESEVRLANRNPGLPLESLRHEITPVGQHYLLTHFDVPAIDPEEHRLRFDLGFDAPFELCLDDVRAMPARTIAVTLECAGNGRRGHSSRSVSMPWGNEAVGTAEWTGTPLAPLIERAQPTSGTSEIAFFGLDRGFDDGVLHNFGRSLRIEQIAEREVLLVYEMNGQPLLAQHGAPFRLIVPGWYGMASVKWLSRVEALSEPFQGFQQAHNYRYRQEKGEPGKPITAMRVRSLMMPPGVPDWSTRARFLNPGKVTVQGRAWSGNGVPITKVEFGVDDEWSQARLQPGPGQYAWTGWQAEWDAGPGQYLLKCRATDANGAVQPLEPPWDVAGFGNNAVQTIPVLVRDL